MLSAAALGVACAFLVISYLAFRTSSSADFLAVWMAGKSFAAGQPDLVYPTDGAYFTMLPPDAWLARLAAQGYDGEIYPFIYPPIWAWAVAKLTSVVTYQQLLAFVSLLNPILFIGILALARRVAAPGLPLWLYLLVGLVFLSLSSIGAIALFQNQPQILVAFLTVLAIERAESGAPRAAGLALALAAAIKLYPILYVLFWLAVRQWRAAAWAVAAGVALGCLSVAVAGWPLHAEFLRLIGAIADTAMLTKLTYTWETALAQVFYYSDFISVAAPDSDPTHGPAGNWLVLPKPAPFALALHLVQFGAIGWMAALFVRARGAAERAAIWPAAFAILSLSSPLSWCYHYLAAAAFLPMLLARAGTATGIGLVALFLFGTSPYVLGAIGNGGFDSTTAGRLIQLLGTCSVTAMAFTLLAHRRRAARPAALPGTAAA